MDHGQQPGNRFQESADESAHGVPNRSDTKTPCAALKSSNSKTPVWADLAGANSQPSVAAQCMSELGSLTEQI